MISLPPHPTKPSQARWCIGGPSDGAVSDDCPSGYVALEVTYRNLLGDPRTAPVWVWAGLDPSLAGELLMNVVWREMGRRCQSNR
jgi:hypothetical protein